MSLCVGNKLQQQQHFSLVFGGPWRSGMEGYQSVTNAKLKRLEGLPSYKSDDDPRTLYLTHLHKRQTTHKLDNDAM